MKVELTRDASYLLAKGDTYSATEEGDGFLLHGSFQMWVPAEWVNVIEIKLADGTVLHEGTIYDVAYRQAYGANKGKVKTLHGWELLGRSRWSSLTHSVLAFSHRGSGRSYGKGQEIPIADIVSVVPTEPS